MNKLQMAHEYFLAIVSNPSVTLRGEDLQNIQHNAWTYADAMQAEAEKRDQDSRSLTKDQEGNCLHFHREFGHKKCMDCGASLDEWQPDWSQAPDNADEWIKSSIGNCYWYCGDNCLGKPRHSIIQENG